MNIACIFDWDGVIIDSSQHHIEAWERLAKEENLFFPKHLFKKSFGMKNEEIIPNLWKWTNDINEIRRLDKKKEEIYRNIMIQEGPQKIKGIDNLLESFKQINIPCAIGSSAPFENIIAGLDKINFKKYFKVIVSGDDVKQGKPSPDIFLCAAKKLNVEPEKCIVFEDAKVGIIAAHRAKMKVVAITTTYPEEELKDADLIVNSLKDVNVEEIIKLLKI
jgi:beta-phosphoglucomutase family hydrolase